MGELESDLMIRTFRIGKGWQVTCLIPHNAMSRTTAITAKLS
jgi:hypothetical protein